MSLNSSLLVRSANGGFSAGDSPIATTELSEFSSSADSVLLPGSTPFSEELAESLSMKKFVAVDFAKFADGRGYSWAKVLRDRYSFKGTLRATGEILVDQLLYLSRCGFDELELAADQKLESAMRAFSHFSEFYQPSAGEVK